jgi:hypothetical protein
MAGCDHDWFEVGRVYKVIKGKEIMIVTYRCRTCRELTSRTV